MTEDELKAIEARLHTTKNTPPWDTRKELCCMYLTDAEALIAEVRRTQEQILELQCEIDDLDDLVRPLPVCQ